jgi:hypothetical protein
MMGACEAEAFTPPVRVAMPRHTPTERAICALYTSGPCSAATVAALIGEDDASSVARILAPLVPTRVQTRSVRLPGQAEAVDLYYLRGAGVG